MHWEHVYSRGMERFGLFSWFGLVLNKVCECSLRDLIYDKVKFKRKHKVEIDIKNSFFSQGTHVSIAVNFGLFLKYS